MDWISALTDTTLAYNQVGLLAGGALCLALGLVCFAALIYERNVGHKYQAKIIGLRADEKKVSAEGASTMYFPIFEYTDTNGDVIRAESSGGSSSLLNKIVGQNTLIYVNSNKPRQASRQGKFLFIFAAGMSLLGIGLNYYALTEYPFNLLSLLGIAIVLGIGAFNLKKIWKPKEERETPSEFMQRKYEEFLEKREKIPVLNDEEFIVRFKRQQEQYRKSIPVLIVIALALFGGSGYMGQDMWAMATKGVHAIGHIKAINSRVNEEGQLMYYPIVSFKDSQGQSIEFKDKVESSSITRKAGEEVRVIYLKENPKKAIIDRGVLNWFVSFGLFLIGVLFLYFAIQGIKNTKKKLTNLSV